MINLLSGGFGLLILSLNLMMMRALLKISGNTTTPSPKIKGLIASSIGLCFFGAVIIVLSFLGMVKGSQEQSVMRTTGVGVTSLALSFIIRIIGHGHEKIIKWGALIALLIGVALVVAYIVTGF
jgi:hypothetical protein